MAIAPTAGREYLHLMPGANRSSAGLLRFSIAVFVFALVFLFLAFGWTAAWIAILFFPAVLLYLETLTAEGASARALVRLSRLPSPRAPPSA